MDSSLQLYPWQQTDWQQLLTYIKCQRIPQALIIKGYEGAGLLQLVHNYAAALLCISVQKSGLACGECPSCKLFLAQTHPDFIKLSPELDSKEIKVDQIRKLKEQLTLKPQFLAYRVIVLHPADSLNRNSANAILKFLEEPPERTIFVLTTTPKAILPATIRSRCQKIICSTPNRIIASQWLLEQGIQENSALLLNITQGLPMLAKTYAETNLLAIRLAYFTSWYQIAKQQANIIEIAEQWQKPNALELVYLLDWIISWVLDIVKLALHSETEQIVNTDFKKALQALAKRLVLTKLFFYYDDLLVSKSQLLSPINKQLLIERLLIDWSMLNTS